MRGRYWDRIGLDLAWDTVHVGLRRGCLLLLSSGRFHHTAFMGLPMRKCSQKKMRLIVAYGVRNVSLPDISHGLRQVDPDRRKFLARTVLYSRQCRLLSHNELSNRVALLPRTSTVDLPLVTPPRTQISARFAAGCSRLLFPILLAHAVFDVVVDDEVEFFVGETIMLREAPVYLVDDCL